jgi:UDP:flavonoid glycosyltransferase YjiC (YdhE family)
MTRYLAYTSPARGHLYPIVPTLLELRDRGHEVHVRTLASELGALRALGLHAEPIADEIEALPLPDSVASSPEEGLGKALATFAERAAHEVPDLQHAIADLAPDALLIDITTVGASAVAEASALPWAQSVPLFQRFSPDPSVPSTVTPVPFGIAPEPGLAVINGPRTELGLSPLAGREEMWRAPLHLYYTACPFELDLAFPPSFRFVGPGVWEPPAPAPGWLADLDAPLLLVSVSSELQSDAASSRPPWTRSAMRTSSSPRAPGPTTPPALTSPPTRTSNAGCRTTSCSPTPPARSATAAWAWPRRRWRPACLLASCHSVATSSRSPLASPPSAPAPA